MSIDLRKEQGCEHFSFIRSLLSGLLRQTMVACTTRMPGGLQATFDRETSAAQGVLPGKILLSSAKVGTYLKNAFAKACHYCWKCSAETDPCNETVGIQRRKTTCHVLPTIPQLKALEW